MPRWSGGPLMGVVATLLGSRRACVHEGVACLSCLPAWPVCTSVGWCSRRLVCLPRPMIESERNIGCLSAPIVDPLRLRSKKKVNLVKQDNGEAWRHLKPLAMKLLSGIGSAGNSERAHKQYGLAQGSNRKRLGPDKADKLTYIQANKMYISFQPDTCPVDNNHTCYSLVHW